MKDKILVSGRELLVGEGDEDDLIDIPSEATIDERANPVECMGDGGGDETGKCGGAVVDKLVQGDIETQAGEHEKRVEMNSARPAFNMSG
ncbi:hypothetical protein VNO80_10259 [Phaseolus coccineus]|uniref:Uncharacterized protein n=1 Tax=Phaseolus coccineus TaxID=3886 RepID=A0AAN9N7S1_PHACN